jgi:hypothetical protein
LIYDQEQAHRTDQVLERGIQTYWKHGQMVRVSKSGETHRAIREAHKEKKEINPIT